MKTHDVVRQTTLTLEFEPRQMWPESNHSYSFSVEVAGNASYAAPYESFETDIFPHFFHRFRVP